MDRKNLKTNDESNTQQTKYPKKETVKGKIHQETITISKKKGDDASSNQAFFTESTSVDGCEAMREKRSQE